MKIFNSILCIGDSLTYGARDEYHRGYPAELALLLNTKYSEQFFSVATEAKCGITSGKILKTIHRSLAHYDNSSCICLLIGTNDTQIRLPEYYFWDHLYQLINICKIKSNKLIVGTLPPLKGIGLFSYDKEGSELIKKYNKIIFNLCTSLKIPIADFSNMDGMIDKCHFNNNGYKKMAEIWMEQIELL